MMWYSRLFSPTGGIVGSRMMTMTRTTTVSSSQSSSPLVLSSIIFPQCINANSGGGGIVTFTTTANGHGTLIINGRNNIGLSLSSQQPPATTVVPTIIQPTQRRYMSKYLSKAATKRLPLTTKRAGKGYYKGKGCTSEGRLTSKGKFIGNPLKKLQLIVPSMADMVGFSLKPYIARSVGKSPPSSSGSTKKENGQLVLGDGQ